MALLLLRHALGMIAAGADDDETPAIFTVFLLKAIGFILPCYIMARAISVAQRRRQQQVDAQFIAECASFGFSLTLVLCVGQERKLLRYCG